jgi:serine/threonine protein phosphatase PrpC
VDRAGVYMAGNTLASQFAGVLKQNTFVTPKSPTDQGSAPNDTPQASPSLIASQPEDQGGIEEHNQDLKGLSFTSQPPDNLNEDSSEISLDEDLRRLQDAPDNDQDTLDFQTDWLIELQDDSRDRTGLPLGRAVDNHRRGKPQEDRHYAMSFPTLSTEEATTFLSQTIDTVDRRTRHNDSGSTLTGVVITHNGDVVTAHLGDSPVSTVIIDENGKLKRVQQLTVDHDISNQTGWKVAPDGTLFQDTSGRRVLDDGSNINMTHAIGDCRFGQALCHQPDIHAHNLQEQLAPGDRLFLLITTDGAHTGKGIINHSTHARTIERGLQNGRSLNRIARQISDNSAPIEDNVTVLLLEVHIGTGAAIAVFDGHAGFETAQQACDLFQSISEDFARTYSGSSREH